MSKRAESERFWGFQKTPNEVARSRAQEHVGERSRARVEFGGRATDQNLEVAYQMRVVEVTGFRGDGGPAQRGCTHGHANRALHARDAGERLRVEPHRLVESALNPAYALAQSCGNAAEGRERASLE